MKDIFKLLIAIIFISFIGDKLIYVILNKVSDRVYTGQSIGKLNQYLAVKNDADIIVFGSSRAHHHVDVAKLSDQAYNMGVNGRFITYHSALIKLLPAEKSQTIILHIDPDRAVDLSYDGSDIVALSSKFHRDKIIKSEIGRIEKRKVLQHFYWCLDYNGKTIGILQNFIKSRNLRAYGNGYDALYVSEVRKERFRNVLAQNIQKACNESPVINELYKTHLREIVAFAKENNSKIFVITSPIYSDKCKEDNNIFRSFLDKIDIEYLDFSDLFNEDNQFDYWRDETHLSHIGADIFTDTLISALAIKP